MPSTDRGTDGRTDGRTRWIQYTLPPTSLGGGIKKHNTIALPMELYLICIMAPIKYIPHNKYAHDWAVFFKLWLCHQRIMIHTETAHFSTGIMPLYFHRNIEQEQRSMLNYLRLPKLVYMQRAHYFGVIMDVVVSPITSHMILCSTVYKDADQRKYQSPASLAFVRGIHLGPVNS